jgi:hypothetical protein
MLRVTKTSTLGTSLITSLSHEVVQGYLHYPRLANLYNILLVCLLSTFSVSHARFEMLGLSVSWHVR